MREIKLGNCTVWLIVLLMIFTVSSPAKANIVADRDSILKSTEIIFPENGQVFWVPNKYSTIDVTALGNTWIAYNALATLDIEPYTGYSTGGTLFHNIELNFDGETLDIWKYEYVPNAPEGELEGPWEFHLVSVGSDLIQ